MSDAIAFSRISISPLDFIREAFNRVKGQYGLFLGITLVGMLLGGMAPLGVLLGPMMCGIFLCYRTQALGQPVSFDLLFKGFDHFMESFITALLMIAASFVLILPVMLFFFAGIFATVLGGAADHHAAQGLAAFSGCFLIAIGVVLVMVGSMFIQLFFLFSFPLIMDRGLKGMEAVQLSFKAAKANLGGLLLLGLLNLLLSLAGLLCCYVGAFLVLPITLGTHWLCYERIFGINGAETPRA